MIVHSRIQQAADCLGVALIEGRNEIPDDLPDSVMRGIETLRVMGLVDIMDETQVPEVATPSPVTTYDQPARDIPPDHVALAPTRPGPKKAGKRKR